ncbi:toprim domain protein [Collibacillus ludicampi]|uniref:Toprim domain protein n=1 Tax=Collibacillus ludicampi TaxID=2771369 RepID=A0AAV4LBX9_9BACL|nr:toprim domain-containing protein [Collibacillus ludicampi]GIM45204.1 toprim domain protein [Collibacillus ludicampi]
MDSGYVQPRKFIIVEGRKDKERLLQILDEPVEIICTYGTLSEEKIERLIIPLQYEEVYILVDADDAGNKLRTQLKRELPHAKHLYTRKMYRQVQSTPLEYLAEVLMNAHFEINEDLFFG